MILLIAFVIVFIAVCVWLLISLSKHDTKGFVEVILFLGLFGIICAITAFYMKHGFKKYKVYNKIIGNFYTAYYFNREEMENEGNEY